MYIDSLIKVYEEKFGLWNNLKKSIEKNKLILVPISLLVASLLGFYSMFLFGSYSLRPVVMILTIVTFIISLSWGVYLHKKTITESYGSTQKYYERKLEEVENFMKENFNIKEEKDYILIETLVTKEIERIEENYKFPFLNIIRQLIIAVFITGLLSYSFNQLEAGNIEKAVVLLTFYILLVGTLIIIGLIVYSTREFTRIHKLKEIRILITELRLKLSISKRADSRQQE